MNGWVKVGEYCACSLCGARLTDEAVASSDCPPQKMESGSTDQLADFLGASEKKEAKVVIEDDGERRFCRDCIEFLPHPFQDRCARHQRPVNPMDDCPDFCRRQKS